MKNWENHVRKVVPYVAGEQPKEQDVIKLNTNENPYPPAPGVGKVIQNFDCEVLRKYPDPDVSALTSALAKQYGLDRGQVFVGVGSDDVLAMSFLTFFNSGKPVLFPDITYSFYDVWADLYRIPYECQPLDEDFCIKKEDYMKPNGGIVLANPNAPTGVMTELAVIEEIIAANQDVVVIVDEAYVDFDGRSCVPLIEKYDNLLVVQTFSKSRALAGMRIGYAMGSQKLIQYLKDVKFSFNSYTMNALTIAAGVEQVQRLNVSIPVDSINIDGVPLGFHATITEPEENYGIVLIGLSSELEQIDMTALEAYVDMAAWMAAEERTEVEDGYYRMPLAVRLPEDSTVTLEENWINVHVTEQDAT